MRASALRIHLLLISLALWAACTSPVAQPDDGGSTSGSGTAVKDTTVARGDGTIQHPYNTAALRADTAALALGSVVAVEGYIVGFCSSTTYNSAVFGTGDGRENTNILIASSPDEKHAALCVGIQLPKGEYRTAFQLSTSPELLGQRIVVSGTAATYLRLPGVKQPEYAVSYDTWLADYGTASGDGSGTGDDDSGTIPSGADVQIPLTASGTDAIRGL